MAIAFVAASNGATSFGSSITFALNVGSTADRFVCVLVGDYSVAASTAPTGVTYNGVSLTSGTEITHSNGSRKFRTYWGVTTATGSNNVVVSFNNGDSIVFAVAACWSGVDQTTPIRGGAEVGVTGTSTAPSVTISSDAADTVGMLTLVAGSTRSITPSSPAVERYDIGTYYFVLDEAGASSVTIDGALSGTDDWIAAAVSMIAASGGGGGSGGGPLTGGLTRSILTRGRLLA